MIHELKQKGVCATFIQNLHESCEIDWYLQVEIAYNKRFGINSNIINSDNKAFDKKVEQKTQANKINFSIPWFFS